MLHSKPHYRTLGVTGETMKINADLHADEWKSGTEALAFCVICGGEYPPGTQECPDCNVSLSMVRRCPACQKIVSAQHKKCVYCRTPFTEDLAKPLPELFPEVQEQEESVRRFRAGAVSIATFMVVFLLGMFFLKMIQKPVLTMQVLAKARMLHSVPARRAPTSNSSNLGKVISGTPVRITGYQESDQGRWMTLEWNNMAAYVPMADVSAPHPINADGASALKFYISGIDSPDSARESLNAVDEYAKAFPGDAHVDELRFALAERLRALSQRGGPEAPELHRQSTQIFEDLAAGNGSFAGQARAAQEQASRSSARPADRKRAAAAPKRDSLQIIGGSGTRTSTAPSTAHEVTIH